MADDLSRFDAPFFGMTSAEVAVGVFVRSYRMIRVQLLINKVGTGPATATAARMHLRGP